MSIFPIKFPYIQSCSRQTCVTQTPDDVRKKYSAIYSLGNVYSHTFCTMLLYLLAYRRCAKTTPWYKELAGSFLPKDSLNHFFKIPNLMSLMGAFLAAFTLRVYCVI